MDGGGVRPLSGVGGEFTLTNDVVFFTLTHIFRYLYGQLIKEPIITNSNKARIVEVLRSIAELMIWGDQHNPTFFDFFAEKNILSNFVRILSQKCDNKVR